MKKNVIVIFILLIFLLSCKKKVENGSPEFIGHWFTQSVVDMHLDMDISESSYTIYSLYSSGHKTIYKGTARANAKHLKIGSTRYFDIIEYPHEIDTALEKHHIYDSENNTNKLANWKMVLDGIKPNDNQFCGIVEYYKAEY